MAFLGAALIFNPPSAQSFSGPAALPALDESDLRVDMLQTGRGGTNYKVRGALVFRVRANDERVGSRDGDGIQRVDLTVLNRDRKRGDPIRKGDTYLLRAQVDAEDGRKTIVNTYIVIR